MPNLSGNAYGLTTLCPIAHGALEGRSRVSLVREQLDGLQTGERSPLAKIPDLYLARLFVIDDVVYQGKDLNMTVPWNVPCRLDRLKSAYLVFTANFHGPKLEPWLWRMWDAATADIRQIWSHCVAFDQVRDAATFASYIKRCQVETTFYFNGSTDESLAEQLKGLYLKQELSRFAFDNQGKPPDELAAAFADFLRRTRPDELGAPTWRAGASALDTVVIGEPKPVPRGPKQPGDGTAGNGAPAATVLS